MRNKPVRAIISFLPSELEKRSVSHFILLDMEIFGDEPKILVKELPNNLTGLKP
jgi:hypothetical protein